MSDVSPAVTWVRLAMSSAVMTGFAPSLFAELSRYELYW